MFNDWQLESALALVGALAWSAAGKGTLLFAGAGLAACLLRRRSAATRHAIWAVTAIGALLLPTLELSLPRWNLPQATASFAWNVPAIRALPRPANTAGALPQEAEGAWLPAMVSKPDAAPAGSAEIQPEVASSLVSTATGHSRNATTIVTLPTWSFAAWVGACWVAGFVAALAPVAGGLRILSRLRRDGEQIVGGRLWCHCRSAAARLGYRGPMELMLSSRHDIPMTWGFLRPVLLLPREAIDWPDSRLRLVLMHELAHMQRGDYLSQLLGQLMRAAHWFNPLAWWSLRKLRSEAEQACDDTVLAAGTDAADYAEQLVSITATARGGYGAPAPALGMGRAARLQLRVQAILDPAISRHPLSMPAAGSMLVAMLVVTGLTAAYGTVARGANAAGDSSPSAVRETAVAAQDRKSDVQPKPAEKPSAEPVVKPAVTADKNDNAATGDGDDAVSEVRNLIRKQFAGKKDERALTEAAIRGMLQGLNDPYSEFLPQEKFRQMEQEIKGSLAGIGAHLAPEKDRLLIVTPLPGSPAQKAGLQSRDSITSIDGKGVGDFTLEKAIQAIRGPSGTQVRLGIRRANGSEEEIVVTRGEVILPSVKGWSVDRDGVWHLWLNRDARVGYVRITDFRSRAPEEFKSAVKRLAGMKGLILDLRHNPGGLLTATTEIAETLLAEGTIVTVWTGEKLDQTYQTKSKALIPFVPLIVLVDEKTSSAAEILAGALKDNDRAVILGARTFGKGSVQSIHQLAGEGAVKLTTAEFRLPSGRAIDRQRGAPEWGVDPTDGYFLPLSGEEQTTWQRVRAQKDLPVPSSVEAPNLTDGEIERDFADPQLAAALKSMMSRISHGAFIKTGQSTEQLRAYYERHEQLQRQREAAVKALQDIDGEISKLSR